ncbi:MAG: esterase family protein [Prevotellaceae bacterium]|jgi:S-formylglutathione hydrolase FrmB|nr:esterase family protein [Prevotellaceae bacterium]
MKRKQILSTALLFCLTLTVQAARVDTVQVRSDAMNKTVEVIYILPDKAVAPAPVACPTVYLLHGFGGNARMWLTVKPQLPAIADAEGIIFVCPSASISWYWDSPKDPAFRYETFVGTELPAYTDATYATIARREGRAITGLSMGGHGALWLAFRHPDVFGAAGSTSGGVDIRPFPTNWMMSRMLGEYVANREVWDNHTVVNQIDRITDGQLALIIDCGVDDFFLEVNKTLHQRLLGRGINHDFIIRPGGHSNEYWNNSIDYQILYFRKYFSGYR